MSKDETLRVAVAGLDVSVEVKGTKVRLTFDVFDAEQAQLFAEAIVDQLRAGEMNLTLKEPNRD